LCATNVAARGLDIDGIDQVINYELPESAEHFTHRAGRTGRMGRKGEAITFVTPDDADKLRQIEKRLGRRLTRSAQLLPLGLPAVPRPPKLQYAAVASRQKRFFGRYA
jgi:ATP-dependent RNA helicase DeaD